MTVMKIVVLDGFNLNPGDLSWDGFQKLGSVTVYDRTLGGDTEVQKRIEGADIVLTNKTRISGEVIAKASGLRYIGVLATGYDVVALTAARKRGVTVTNVPEYGTRAVAQFTIALLLELCHKIGLHAQSVQQGEWSRCADFSLVKTPQLSLSGRAIGIIGLGKIGRSVARIAHALGMEVMAHSRSQDSTDELQFVEQVDLDTLLSRSDVVSLHCPLTDATRGIICRGNLEKMKKGALLLNTSRGGLVVEAELKEALDAGNLAGAAVDVVSEEPILPDNPLLKAKNCLITPHMAWAAQDARQRLMDTAVQNLQAFLDGHPVHVVGGSKSP